MSTKKRTHFGTTIDTNLLGLLKELSATTQINQSKLMDKAIELLLKEYEWSIQKSVNINGVLDDMSSKMSSS